MTFESFNIITALRVICPMSAPTRFGGKDFNRQGCWSEQSKEIADLRCSAGSRRAKKQVMDRGKPGRRGRLSSSQRFPLLGQMSTRCGTFILEKAHVSQDLE